MANKTISQLTAATEVTSSDLFVLEQSGVAKKLTGQTLEDWLFDLSQAHGMITDISYTAPASGSLSGTLTITLSDNTSESFTVTNGRGISSVAKTAAVPPSLTDTYRINYSDGTYYDFSVDNGRSISSITWVDSGTAGNGQTHTGTIHYNDGTTSTVVIKDGVKGDNGSNGSAATIAIGDVTTGNPDSPASVTNSGTSSAAVFDFTIPKGDKGDTGNNGTDATISIGTVTTGAAGSSASVTNSGTSSAAVFDFVIPKGDTGATGATGDNWFVYIKWAGVQPTSDNDMGDLPDEWMGVYGGASSSAPTHYTDYQWYKVKGDTGNAGQDGTDGTNGTDGAPATLSSATITYQASDSGTDVPAGTWLSTIPSTPQGDYLWSRAVITFNTGNPITFYGVSRNGFDGQGAPATTTPLADSTDGAVGESTNFARADHRHPLPVADDIICDDTNSAQDHFDSIEAKQAIHVTWSFSSNARSYSDARITANSRVVDMTFGTPSNVRSDITWTTANGSVTLSGTVNNSTTVDLVLLIPNT